MKKVVTQEMLASRKAHAGVERARKLTLDNENLQALVFEQEPFRVQIEDLRALLMSAVITGASDVTLQSDTEPRAEIHGRQYKLTKKVWTSPEVDDLLNASYNSASARTSINAREVLDYAFEINLIDGSRQRFRVNATGINGVDGNGVEITFRALPQVTPTLEMVGIDDAMLTSMSPEEGLVVVAGATGSGKSTSLAAVIRHHIENTEDTVKIVDIQAPIEFTYRDLMVGRERAFSSMIGQSEVGRHIPSFAEGVRSALRRAPDIVVVGEARDFETITASIEVSMTGHLAYTTTHAGSVPDAMRRLLSTFPAAERESRAYDLVSTLRFIMVQHLVRRCDRPGRVPVREYLRFTDRIRAKLFNAPIQKWPALLMDEVARDQPDRTDEDLRKSLVEYAQNLIDQGIISIETARKIIRPGQ